MLAPLAPAAIRTAGGGLIRVAKPAGSALLEGGSKLRGALFGTEEKIMLLEVKRVRGGPEPSVELTPETYQDIMRLRELPPESLRRGVQTALFAEEPHGYVVTKGGWLPIAGEEELLKTRLHMIEKEFPRNTGGKGVQVTLPQEFEVISTRRPGILGYWDLLSRKIERSQIIETGEVSVTERVSGSKKAEGQGIQMKLRDIFGEFDEFGEPIWGELKEIKKPSKPMEWEVKTKWVRETEELTGKQEGSGSRIESKGKSGSLELVDKGEETSLFGRRVRIVDEVEEYSAPARLIEGRRHSIRGPLIAMGGGGLFLDSFDFNFGEIGLERARSLVSGELKPDVGARFDIGEGFVQIRLE